MVSSTLDDVLFYFITLRCCKYHLNKYKTCDKTLLTRDSKQNKANILHPSFYHKFLSDHTFNKAQKELPFKLGTREGRLLSSVLFVIAQNVLANAIQKRNGVEGSLLLGLASKVSM